MASVSKAERERDSKILAKRAQQVQRGGARAAVLGVNDGLVSILCLVLGVAAAGGDTAAVLLAGFAGVIAGAFSMAAGEWISVQSQVDLFDGVLSDLKKLVKNDRGLLEENLVAHLIDDGYDTATATTAVKHLSRDENLFYHTYAEQVIGVNPNELGSPWTAAISSFLLFTAGSLAPILPWFFSGGAPAVWWSVILTGLGGLATGAYVSYSSGKSLWYGALRQFIIIAFASAITYGIGMLFGTVIG